jgi:hypothetical protein
VRKLIAVGLACSAFGGTVGVLVTAAVQSDASTDAHTAALVQRVIDQSAEQNLIGIKTKLSIIQSNIGPSGVGTGAQILKHLENIDSSTHAACEADAAIASSNGRFESCPIPLP